MDHSLTRVSANAPAAGPIDRLVLDKAFNLLESAVWIFDIDRSRVVWANDTALSMWAAETREELLARDMARDMSPAVARRLRQYQSDFIASNATFTEMWTLYPKGVPRPMRVRFCGVILPDGRMAMLCEGRDELSLQPEAIRSADALLHTQLMISMHDAEGRLLYCNPAARSSFENGLGEFKSRFVRTSDYKKLMKCLQVSGETSQILRVHTAHGIRWHEMTARSCYDPVSALPSILVSETDVSELKEAEALAQSQAHHDPLTGLPNRLALTSLFERLVERNSRLRRGIAVLFIDLDQFKAINDTLGHDQGDAVLKEVARRLLALKSGNDAVVRLGGDEFLFLASDGRSGRSRIERLAADILRTLALPVQGARRMLTVTPSIGIARYPEHGQDAQTLMQCADIAMYCVKADGRNQFRIYHEKMRSHREEELELLSDLRDGLREGHITAFYQPRFSASEKRFTGVEALARWHHPVRGLIMPGQFIDMAEKAGLIEQIGSLVLEQAVRQRAEWSRLGVDLEVSVNVSLRQLCKPAFSTLVSDVLARYQCSAGHLELEITETAIFENSPVVHENLEQIRALGVRVAIDDFGTGYSNLARLSEMAIDCIKLDRSLIKDLPRNQAIVRMVIAMCKFMRVTIVAEGVETADLAYWASAYGCHELQGYYFGKPMPAHELEALMLAPPTFADLALSTDVEAI